MIRLQYANCLSSRVGAHGLDASLLGSGGDAEREAAALTARLASTRGTGWERWRDLPFSPMRDEHVNAVRTVVERCADRFDNLVVLGIGGSALGNRALHAALTPATWNLDANVRKAHGGGPRLFVVDNVDPANTSAILDFCATNGGLERTLFNVISKSGETAETAAQFMTIRAALIDALGRDAHSDHIVAITDPAKGTMRQICNDNGYTTLPVPEGVGGRFSVLSPVGLFSAAMCGIDIEALLDGAAEMDTRCSQVGLRDNPAAMLATLLVRLGREKGKVNHVLMPYANGLYLLADWFRQLWAESLGKRKNTTGEDVFAGFTPIKALGATDQHSQIQLYREGPNDKVIGLISVRELGPDITIPAGLGVDALAYLENASMGGLLDAERRATEYALVESQRPNFTLEFPRLDARCVGQFLALWEVTTAYAGLMLGIDAYDQPAVETGKRATFGLMGRVGYGEWAQTVNAALSPTDCVV